MGTHVNRNTLRYCNGAELVLIGLDNQMKVHYTMPVRTMLYDSLRYTRQCKELEQKNRAENNFKNSDEFLSGIVKSDRIKPVITLVLSDGEKDWETLAAIGAATGSVQLVDYAHEHKGGQINMCTALDNLKKEGIQEEFELTYEEAQSYLNQD